MDHQDREAIEDLFRRIGEVERRSGPRDRESAAFIRALIEKNPSAPYYMAQTIIVQQQALEAAQVRLEEFEGRGGQRQAGGGFLDSIFGGARQQHSPGHGIPRVRGEQSGWGTSRRAGSGMGGGFLAGAAQTAMGVAGGVVLGNMLADMLSPDEAAAAGIDQDASGAVDATGADGTEAADAGGDFGGDFDLGDF